MNIPVSISIITCSFNSAATIEDTLRSVAAQTHPAVEHIVIDGGSTDGTVTLLERYRSSLAKVVSEADSNMYEAMNKGIALAGGEVIGILNSDDIYAGSEVLADVAAVFAEQSVDVCYGDLLYVDRINTGRVIRYWRAGQASRRQLYLGWMPPHPAFFVRRHHYALLGGYRTDFGSAADYELMLRFLLKERLTPVYIPRTLVRMRAGGSSNASLGGRLKAHLMDWRAWYVNRLLPYPWTVPLKPLRKLHQWLDRG